MARANPAKWLHFEVEGLVETASECVRAGDLKKASELLQEALHKAEGIRGIFRDPDSALKATAFYQIADVYLLIGQKERALEILFQSLRLITGKQFVSYELKHIARIFVSAGEFEQVSRVIEMIATNQADTLIELARGYERVGCRKKAVELLDRALASLKADRFLKVEHGDSWSELLEELAVVCAKIGHYDRAMLAAKTITDVYPQNRVRALARIAGEYAKTGDTEKSQECLLGALKEIKNLKHVSDKSWPLNLMYARDKVEALVAVAEQYAVTNLPVDDNAKRILQEIVLER